MYVCMYVCMYVYTYVCMYVGPSGAARTEITNREFDTHASPPGEQHPHADATRGLQEALARAVAAEAAAKRKDEQIDR